VSDPWEIYYSQNTVPWKGSPYELPDLEKGALVLDIGCGTGSTLIKGLEKGWEITGVDVSPSAIEQCRKRLDERGLACDLITSDLIDLEIKEKKFDLILCHYVLGALSEEKRRLASLKIMEMLSEGGSILFEDLASGDFREGNGELIEERTFKKGNGITQHFFLEEELSNLFGDLEIMKISTDEWFQGKLKRRRLLGHFIRG
jgi:cyclopropane fatty-acyl-phospholipid synthase-like methyltransferase